MMICMMICNDNWLSSTIPHYHVPVDVYPGSMMVMSMIVLAIVVEFVVTYGIAIVSDLSICIC